MKNLLLFAMAISLAGCTKTETAQPGKPTQGVALPTSWVGLPENKTPEAEAPGVIDKDSENKAAAALDRLYDANSKTLEKIDSPQPAQGQDPSKPKDWVPWHLEMFTTDIGVTAQGLVGVLTLKGNPAVQTFWRRLPEAPVAPKVEVEPARDKPAVAAQLSQFSTPDEVSRQVEPMVQAALATGNIRDESALRQKLVQTATEFQQYVLAIDSTNATEQATQWWVSGFRFDFTVSANGSVVPIGTVGAELRLRFEWKRLMRSQPANAPAPAIATAPKTAEGLKAFVGDMRGALERVSEDTYTDRGFHAVAFRIGVGVTATGQIGIAKASGTMLGHLNFSRDFKKPKTLPSPITDRPVLLIEDSQAGHQGYASVNGIPYESELDLVVYQVDRTKFQNGLQKAIRIGKFFAERGSQNKPGRWNVYEIKTGYDMSITGNVGLIALAGLASAEITFRNLNF